MPIGTQPSGLYSTQQLAEFVLQRVGAFPTSQTAADPVDIGRTLTWMDLAVSEIADVEECWWLVPATVTQALSATTAQYTLNQFTNYPQLGVANVMKAYRSDGTNDTPIKILSREEYEDIEVKSQAGSPDAIFVDRLPADNQVYVNPVPSDTTWSLKLVVQTFAPDVRGGEGTLVGADDHKFWRSWQLWLISRTAYLVSGGPVRKLDRSERNDIAEEASSSLQALIAFQNREKAGQPRRTQPWGRAY